MKMTKTLLQSLGLFAFVCQHTQSDFVPFANELDDAVTQHDAVKTLSLSSSCNNLRDGVHYIKPSSDGEIIPTVCSNGYTVINLALNQDSVSSYFTSFYQYNWNYGGVYSGDCDMTQESSSWREWWTPATEDTKFRIAEDCTTCEESLSYGDNTAYYMTNYFFCWNKHHSNTCSYSNDELLTMDSLSYDVEDDTISMCNVCDDIMRMCNGGDEWCDCMALQLDADTVTSDNHDNCVQKTSVIVKPSIAANGKYCTCYQQSDTSERAKQAVEYRTEKDLDALLPEISHAMYKKYKVEQGLFVDSLIRVADELDTETKIATKLLQARIVETHADTVYDAKKDEDDDDSSSDCDTKYFLSNDDFTDGTYRIQACGEYVLTEDILIHFGKPSEDDMNDPDWSPNAYDRDDYPWYPTSSQQSDGTYEGADALRGTYQAGFWAGMTIEHDDVTVDLNGFKMEMDWVYYIQQRFFVLIAMGNRPFIQDQGPANFGRQTYAYVSNIRIRNGELGRTSHHGIHGNGVTSLVITDMNVHNFDVAGIQCNGCQYGKILDSVVGPQNDDIPVFGKYTHGRSILPRLKYLVENYGDKEVVFGGQYGGYPVTIEELADEFVEQMDMIYHYIVNGIDYANGQDSEQWERAKKLFVNPTGLQDGGSSYGINLNGLGTGVVAFGRRKTGSTNMIVKNVEIHGLTHQPWERMWATYHGSSEMQGFMFDPLDWPTILDADNGNTYKGDAYHDLVFATQRVASKDEFCLYNTMFVSPVESWAFEDDVASLEDNIVYHCGSDVQSHDAKGTMGLRVDAVQGLTLENLYIHDITNHGDLGAEYLCGNWNMISFVSSTYELVEPGYTGTRAHGMLFDFAKVSNIQNVQIENIRSKHGTAIGASIYQGTTVHKVSNIKVEGIHAGWAIAEDDVDSLATQNRKPRACAFEVGQGDDTYPVVLKTDTIEHSTIVGASINGYDICASDERIGKVYDDLTDEEKEANILLNEGKFEVYKFENYNKHVTLDTTTTASNGGMWYNWYLLVNKMFGHNGMLLIIGCVALSIVILGSFCYLEGKWIWYKLFGHGGKDVGQRKTPRNESSPLLTNTMTGMDQDDRYIAL